MKEKKKKSQSDQTQKPHTRAKHSSALRQQEGRLEKKSSLQRRKKVSGEGGEKKRIERTEGFSGAKEKGGCGWTLHTKRKQKWGG